MVSIRYFCGVGEFRWVKSNPGGTLTSKIAIASAVTINSGGAVVSKRNILLNCEYSFSLTAHYLMESGGSVLASSQLKAGRMRTVIIILKSGKAAWVPTFTSGGEICGHLLFGRRVGLCGPRQIPDRPAERRSS